MKGYVRGNPASVESVLTTASKEGASPILSLSVGTAGATRNWRFTERMGDAGRLHRIQSVVVYDYNQGTLDRIRRRMARSRGRYGTMVHLPEKVRASDGFLLNPYAFSEQLGVIDDDMERLVAKVMKRTHETGAPPQLIIEFLGFGGHAILGLLLHEKIRDAFPDAYCLPVVALPRDSTLQDWMRDELERPAKNVAIQGWMRDGTWKAYERKLKLNDFEDCLVIDNLMDGPPNDALAIGLATISCAGSDSLKAGSIPEAVGGMRHEAQGWLGMSVIKKNLPARKGWASWFPLRRLKPVWSSDDELPVQIKVAIKESLIRGGLLQMKAEPSSARTSRNGGRQVGPDRAQPIATSQGVSTDGGQPWPDQNLGRRIYVACPVDVGVLRVLETHVLKQLAAERFWDTYPKAHIRFGSARFPQRPDDDLELQGRLPEEIPVRFFRSMLGVVTLPVTSLYRLGRLALFGPNPEETELHAVVAALYPLPGRIARVDQILYGHDENGKDGLGRAGETGFGKWVHAEAPNGTQAEVHTTNGDGRTQGEEALASEEYAPDDGHADQAGSEQEKPYTKTSTTAQAEGPNGSDPHSGADEQGGDSTLVGVPTRGPGEASLEESPAGGLLSEGIPQGDLNEQSDSEMVDSRREAEDDSSESTP